MPELIETEGMPALVGSDSEETDEEMPALVGSNDGRNWWDATLGVERIVMAWSTYAAQIDDCRRLFICSLMVS